MEFVALSDTVLRALALDDPQLRRVFQGVYPADQLPRSPPKSVRAAYIFQHRSCGRTGTTLVGAVDETQQVRDL